MAAPRKHPPADAAKKIEELAAAGHSLLGIARHFNVSRDTVTRWCKEDHSLQEAFDMGRETERQYLHSLVVQSAAQNKPANVNAFFILKARHGYREADAASAKIDVGVVPSVMIVHNHGTDDQWAAKLAAQQRRLIEDHTTVPKPEASHAEQLAPVATIAPSSYLPPVRGSESIHAGPTLPAAPVYVAPVWSPKA